MSEPAAAAAAAAAGLGRREDVKDLANNLDCFVQRGFLDGAEEKALFDELKMLPWFRVKYLSERHGNSCTTPCWTNFFGGVEGVLPFQPIPAVFNRLIARVQQITPGVRYNAILLRLYFDGQDNIAWHTDGRTFLGDTPTIASLSLGARSSFELRKMTNVWPCTGTPNGGVDSTVAPLKLALRGGDMLVMQGKTQQSWHHRVPQEKGRGPRININFRYILPGRDETTVRGVRAFYKYMVCGDDKTEDWQMTATSFRWADIVRQHGPMHFFVNAGPGKPQAQAKEGGGTVTTAVSAAASASTSATASASATASTSASTSDSALDPTSASASEHPAQQWVCQTCTLLNPAAAARCEACDSQAVPATAPAPAAASSAAAPVAAAPSQAIKRPWSAAGGGGGGSSGAKEKGKVAKAPGQPQPSIASFFSSSGR